MGSARALFSTSARVLTALLRPAKSNLKTLKRPRKCLPRKGPPLLPQQQREGYCCRPLRQDLVRLLQAAGSSCSSLNCHSCDSRRRCCILAQQGTSCLETRQAWVLKELLPKAQSSQKNPMLLRQCFPNIAPNPFQ